MTQRKPTLGFIFITLLLDIIGLGLVIPVLPKLIESFSTDMVQTASTYGIFIAVYALMQFLFSPLLGAISDKVGRRPVILISLFGAGLDYLLLFFAPSLTWLFVGRIIAGITAANLSTITAYIADISADLPPDQRAKNFGTLGAAFGIGFILGPLLGGVIGETFGVRAPFLVVACLTLINWLYGFFVLPESLAKENRRDFNLAKANPINSLIGLGKYKLVLGMAATFLFVSLGQNILQSTWSLYTIHRYSFGPREIGISLAVVGFVAGAVQGGLTGRIVKRFGERKTVVFGLLINAIGFLLYGLATQGWMFYMIPFFSALGGVAGPASQSIISNAVNPNEQGQVQGSLASLTSLMGIAGPLVGTAVFSYFIGSTTPIYLPGAPFFLGGLLCVIGMLLAINTFKRLPEKKAGAVNLPIVTH